jgi:DNA-binding transcriptional LysR family regulator
MPAVQYIFGKQAYGSGIESPTVNFRHVRAFIAVAEEASITRAAERLHISQPPLSRQIQQLEEEIGITLFVRHRHGVTLTEAGRELLQKARLLDASAADFFDAACQSKSGGSNRVRAGIAWGLWEALNRIRVECARWPAGVTIETTDVHCLDQYNEQLRTSALDVVFARPPFDTTCLDSAPLFQDRIVAVMSDNHPLALRKTVRIRDLAHEPLLLWDRHIMPGLYDKVLELYAAAHISTKMIPTPGAGPYNHAGMMLAASGKGLYLCIGIPLTSPQPPSGVAVVPISDADATIDVCVAWRKSEASPMVLQFLECVWRVFPQARPAPAITKTPSRRAS